MCSLWESMERKTEELTHGGNSHLGGKDSTEQTNKQTNKAGNGWRIVKGSKILCGIIKLTAERVLRCE